MDLTKPYQNIQYRVGATNKDLQRAIEAAVPAAVVQMKDQSNQFRGLSEKETAKKIFDFLKTQVHYKVDGDNQKIKLPSALLREREGDCKSYALFTAAVLSNIKIPYKFVYASYNPYDRTPEHIYVVTNNGTIIDAVWGTFNSEKKASYKFYKPMNISYISGIRGHKPTKHEHKHKHHHVHHYSKSIGNTGGPICAIGSMGIGRTGTDWASAVGINLSTSDKLAYAAKNISLAPARLLLTDIISKNAGGIANFLFNISPMNTGEINQTNLSLLKAQRDLLIKSLNEKQVEVLHNKLMEGKKKSETKEQTSTGEGITSVSGKNPKAPEIVKKLTNNGVNVQVTEEDEVTEDGALDKLTNVDPYEDPNPESNEEGPSDNFYAKDGMGESSKDVKYQEKKDNKLIFGGEKIENAKKQIKKGLKNMKGKTMGLPVGKLSTVGTTLGMMEEGKKKKKNPWAICTAQMGKAIL